MHDEHLGAGLKLTEDWDLDIDMTGDLATVSGRSELEKDISMLVSIRLQNQLGDSISPRLDNNTLKKIELLTERSLRSDVRVSDVDNVFARAADEFDDMVLVEAEVTDGKAGHELIIEVDL